MIQVLGHFGVPIYPIIMGLDGPTLFGSPVATQWADTLVGGMPLWKWYAIMRLLCNVYCVLGPNSVAEEQGVFVLEDPDLHCGEGQHKSLRSIRGVNGLVQSIVTCGVFQQCQIGMQVDAYEGERRVFIGETPVRLAQPCLFSASGTLLACSNSVGGYVYVKTLQDMKTFMNPQGLNPPRIILTGNSKKLSVPLPTAMMVAVSPYTKEQLESINRRFGKEDVSAHPAFEPSARDVLACSVKSRKPAPPCVQPTKFDTNDQKVSGESANPTNKSTTSESAETYVKQTGINVNGFGCSHAAILSRHDTAGHNAKEQEKVTDDPNRVGSEMHEIMRLRRNLAAVSLLKCEEMREDMCKDVFVNCPCPDEWIDSESLQSKPVDAIASIIEQNPEFRRLLSSQTLPHVEQALRFRKAFRRAVASLDGNGMLWADKYWRPTACDVLVQSFSVTACKGYLTHNMRAALFRAQAHDKAMSLFKSSDLIKAIVTFIDRSNGPSQ